jgi:hypothetical protein
VRLFHYYPTFRKPSGGNKQIRIMATLLAELGQELVLLRDRTFFGPERFDDNVYYGIPLAAAPFPFEEAGAYVQPDDVLVLPEVLLEDTLQVCRKWTCRIAVNNQNGFFGLRYAPNDHARREVIEFAIANAPFVAALCRDYLGVPEERVFHVPYWVARRPFELHELQQPKSLAVCYMPRKLPDQVARVREAVERSHPDVPWVEIDGVPEPQVAAIFRANAIFFSAQDLEGFGLPALEAMACGCVVAGYAGTGAFAHPYATASNGLWVTDRDVPAAIDAVRSAIQEVRAHGVPYTDRLRAAGDTAARYSKEAARTALAELLEVVRDRRYASRQQAIPKLTWSERLFACRLLYDYDRLGWPGQTLSQLSRWTKAFRSRLGLSR